MSTPDDVSILATFGASWVALAVGHDVADYVCGQTDQQADRKGAPLPEDVARGIPKRRGWAANLRHVGQYHLVLITLGALAWMVLPLHWSMLGAVLAVAWSAATHAVLDRRWPVRWLLEHTGQRDFSRLARDGLNGMYLAKRCTVSRSRSQQRC